MPASMRARGADYCKNANAMLMTMTFRRLALLLGGLAAICLMPCVAQGQVRLPNLEAILAATPESSWVKVNLNAWSDTWVSPDLQVEPYVGASKPGSILAAWSSFAWDLNRGDLILWGGGHANYAGNEVYRWHGTTQLWERASVPSQVQPLGGVRYEAIDGAMNAPVAAHTYDNNLFLPKLDRFLTFGGAAFDTGSGQLMLLDDGTIRATGPFLWDPSRGDPNKVGGTTGSHVQRVAPHPEIVGGNMWQDLDIYDGRFAPLGMPSTFVMGVTDVTNEQGFDTVYVAGRMGGGTSQNLFRLQIRDLADRSQDTLGQVGIWWSGTSSQGGGALDPVRRIFLRTGSSNAIYFSYWNLNTAGPNNRDVPITSVVDASGVFSMNANFGMDFDPRRAQFVLWNGGGTVWTAVPPNPVGPVGWVVTRQPPASGAIPPTDTGTGVLGKFKYVPNLDAFMVLDVHGDVWLYKPVGWTDPDTNAPPSVSVTAPVNGAQIAGPAIVEVDAAASDSDGSVVRVDFYVGSTLIGSDSTPPYSVMWNASPGSYNLTAKAIDNGGAVTASLPVGVTVTPPVNVPPQVTIDAPLDGTHVAAGATVQVTASASDSDGTIASVMMYADGTVFATLTGLTSPYAAPLAGLAAGAHVLTVKVTDNAGASTTSAPVTVTVDAAAGSGTVSLQDAAGGYGGTRDTYLDSYNKGTAWGHATQMLEYGGSYTDLVRFAVFASEGGPVPDGSTIVSATLSLYKQSSYDQKYQLRQVLKDWVEGEATWNQARAGVAWATAGAKGVGSDISTAVSATGSVGWNPGWVTFDVTADVAGMSAGAANNGWKLEAVSGTQGLKSFTSREGTATGNRPALVVVYTSGQP
jgi:hypothetical protein